MIYSKKQYFKFEYLCYTTTRGLGKKRRRAFVKQKAKFGGGKARAVKIPSLNPLLFCPPKRKLSKFSVRIFFEKSSDFVQDRQPVVY